MRADKFNKLVVTKIFICMYVYFVFLDNACDLICTLMLQGTIFILLYIYIYIFTPQRMWFVLDFDAPELYIWFPISSTIQVLILYDACDWFYILMLHQLVFHIIFCPILNHTYSNVWLLIISKHLVISDHCTYIHPRFCYHWKFN